MSASGDVKGCKRRSCRNNLAAVSHRDVITGNDAERRDKLSQMKSFLEYEGNALIPKTAAKGRVIDKDDECVVRGVPSGKKGD